MAPSTVWPGMSPETGEQFSLVGRGLPISRPNQFYQRHERYFHVQEYAAAGANTLEFFNVAKSDVCNLANGQVPTERPFWLTGLCVTWQNLDAAGARSGKWFDPAAIASYARADEVIGILQAGRLMMKLNERDVLDVQDLTHFPSDGGAYAPSSNISFAAATASSGVPLVNGMPLAGNRFKLPAPIPILPDKTILVTLLWKSLLTVATKGRLKVELVGESVLPLNS